MCKVIAVDSFFLSFFYSAILRSRANSVRSHVILNEWPLAKISVARVFQNPPKCSLLTALFGCCRAGTTWNCCRHGAFCVHHTTMHIHKNNNGNLSNAYPAAQSADKHNVHRDGNVISNKNVYHKKERKKEEKKEKKKRKEKANT